MLADQNSQEKENFFYIVCIQSKPNSHGKHISNKLILPFLFKKKMNTFNTIKIVEKVLPDFAYIECHKNTPSKMTNMKVFQIIKGRNPMSPASH